jgi:hypothetical protein
MRSLMGRLQTRQLPSGSPHNSRAVPARRAKRRPGPRRHGQTPRLPLSHHTNPAAMVGRICCAWSARCVGWRSPAPCRRRRHWAGSGTHSGHTTKGASHKGQKPRVRVAVVINYPHGAAGRSGCGGRSSRREV